MRSYSALLVFETVFDSVATTGTDLDSLVRYVFEPRLTVQEEDCGTRLGETVDVNFEIEGKIELATGLPISRDRIIDLLSRGVYTTQVRTLSTCITHNGVCAACYAASRPLEPIPEVNSVVTISPVYDRATETIYVPGATDRLTLGVDQDSYTTLLLFRNGVLQDPSTFTVDGTRLQLSQPLPANSYLVARYVTETRVPHMLWLANTYSGSLLGMKPLPGPLLPVRSLLLTDTIPEGVLDNLVEGSKNLTAIPPNMLEYLGSTKDKLEKSLFLIALRTIYGNVTS